MRATRETDSLVARADRLDVVQDETRRLESAIGKLLDLSGLLMGRLRLDVAEVELSDVAREVVAALAPEAKRAGCSVTVSTPGPVAGSWDRSRLDRVLRNLLLNAFKFGAGRPVRVEVEAEPTLARLRVSDQGIGITAEQQSGLFERATRTPPAGFGLWMVRGIVEALHGSVHVVSRPGKGSTFTVEVPRRCGT